MPVALTKRRQFERSFGEEQVQEDDLFTPQLEEDELFTPDVGRSPQSVKDIDEALESILDIEAGFQNQEKDKGNYLNGQLIGTNRGITPAAYKEYYGKDPSIEDMKNLTKEQALDVYKTNYVNKPKFDQISDPNLQAAVVDFGINSGPEQATKVLQKLVGVEADGKLGPNTLQAINNYQGDLLQDYLNQRRDFIKSLNNETYEKGWLNRIDEIQELTSPEIIEDLQKAKDREFKQLGSGAQVGTDRSSLDDLMGRLNELRGSQDEQTVAEMENSAMAGDMNKLQELIDRLKMV